MSFTGRCFILEFLYVSFPQKGLIEYYSTTAKKFDREAFEEPHQMSKGLQCSGK